MNNKIICNILFYHINKTLSFFIIIEVALTIKRVFYFPLKEFTGHLNSW